MVGEAVKRWKRWQGSKQSDSEQGIEQVSHEILIRVCLPGVPLSSCIGVAFVLQCVSQCSTCDGEIFLGQLWPPDFISRLTDVIGPNVCTKLSIDS